MGLRTEPLWHRSRLFPHLLLKNEVTLGHPLLLLLPGLPDPSPEKKPFSPADSYLSFAEYLENCSQPFLPNLPWKAELGFGAKNPISSGCSDHRDDLIQLLPFHVKHPGPRKGNDLPRVTEQVSSRIRASGLDAMKP